MLQVYGLHANADISKNQQETNQLLDSLLAPQGSGGGSGSSGSGSSGGSRESLLLQVAAELDGKLRQPFDIEAAQYK
jgi:dynein heavy chain